MVVVFPWKVFRLARSSPLMRLEPQLEEFLVSKLQNHEDAEVRGKGSLSEPPLVPNLFQDVYNTGLDELMGEIQEAEWRAMILGLTRHQLRNRPKYLRKDSLNLKGVTMNAQCLSNAYLR
jgi:hypothetical protein